MQYGYVPPPPPPPQLLPNYTHAPRYSLWLGGRLGVLAYGGTLYDTETTGNFVGNGAALEVDVGARIERRYIPYLALELGLVPAGHRFEGTGATAGTSFFGVGVRLLAGDVDNVSFASELSFGFRKLQVSRGDTGETWSASGFEFLRIGLGADIRLSTRFTLSPMLTVSGGTLTDTSGSIGYGAQPGRRADAHAALREQQPDPRQPPVELRGLRRGLRGPLRPHRQVTSTCSARSASTASRSGRSPAKARPRWLMRFFSSSPSSAIVFSVPPTTKSGS